MNEKRNKLIWNAIPTLFDVPNPPKPIMNQRKPPKLRESITKTMKARRKTASTTKLTIETNTSTLVKVEENADHLESTTLTEFERIRVMGSDDIAKLNSREVAEDFSERLTASDVECILSTNEFQTAETSKAIQIAESVREFITKTTKDRRQPASTTKLAVKANTNTLEMFEENAEHIESTTLTECEQVRVMASDDIAKLNNREVPEGFSERPTASDVANVVTTNAFPTAETSNAIQIAESPDCIIIAEESSNDIIFSPADDGTHSGEYYVFIVNSDDDSDENVNERVIFGDAAQCLQADKSSELISACPTVCRTKKMKSASESCTKFRSAERKSTVHRRQNKLTIATYPPPLKDLYKKLRTIQNKAARLKKQLKSARETAIHPNLSIDDIISACRDHNVNETTIEIIKVQLKMAVKNRVQWPDTLKKLFVTLYRESPSAYSKWAELLKLPSKTSVHRWFTKPEGSV